MRILLFSSAAMSGALAVVMVLFLAAHRKHEGFAQWTAATALIAVDLLFSALRDLIPLAISVVVVNVALMAAAPMFFDGTRRFVGRGRLPRSWYATAAVALAASLWFLFVRDDIVVRTVILMSFTGGGFAATAVFLQRNRPPAPALLHRLLAAQFALISFSMLGRAAWVFGRSGFTLLTEGPGQYAFFIVAVVLNMGITVTFILMTTERVAAQLSGARAELETRVEELQEALAEVRTLEGLLPICASCKRIRDEAGTWTQMEVYVRDRTHAEFSHGLCPDCMPKYFPPSRPRA